MLAKNIASLETLLEESYYQPLPFPEFEHELYPTVLDIPEDEKAHYTKDIANRYLRQTFYYAPLAYAYSHFNLSRSAVTDAQLVAMFQQSCFGKFLTDIFTQTDLDCFAPFFAQGGNLLKADFCRMGKVQPNQGFYTAASIALFRKEGQRLSLLAIRLDDELLTPQDADRFELAKHFLLMGACYYTVALEHPKVHFPLDSINGITKLYLPQNHLIYKLLVPHFEYSLSVNKAVLHSPRSILKNDQSYIHTALSIERPDFLKNLMVAGYKGIEQHPNYQPYRFSLEPRPLHTDYGIFLRAYYDCILDFVRELLPFITIDEPLLQWADAISHCLSGFPSGNALRQPDTLAKTLAKIIWQSSVEHACDHYSFSQIPVRQLAYRLRIAPHQPASFRLDRRQLRSANDLFRHKMAWRMFFRPNNLQLLQDTDYQFDEPALRNANRRFLAQLRRTEKALKAKKIFVYAPLSGISRSIQY